ncbi:MAG: prepilin-type N-terminal cleavage/methylation domain-containing protein [Patescibacteria group bacterium]|jgi:prepilin-type N-terminal cleavage/methylation domain-containing protein|nr:prepilin-type N-terminal cleavage/methylation domain-containing protein [Patescibacteria group bacterium]
MSRERNGFTLIELLVVITIIGILSTLATVAVNSARKNAKITKAISDISEIRKAIDILEADTTRWPGDQQPKQIGSTANNELCGVDASSNTCLNSFIGGAGGLNSNGGAFLGWSGPYMNPFDLDPWGYEYFFDTDYRIDANGDPCECTNLLCVDAVVIGSYGPDGLGAPTGGAGSYGCDDIILVLYK